MSRFFVNALRRPTVGDGAAPLFVRLVLLVAGLGVLALGVFQLPQTATTHGEIAVGLVLSIAVAMQILFAAVFLPGGARRV